ncbi:MAG: methylated-DNA--[protein]-cysteine S-methyltransferase [Proteobacteria bacterium]|nr:methylated-DNA--[protein]-cysteine S-methyltransferase [Pseudomonadota bacterium]MBI3496171.1 methylated-DNA--[protein]-cysteine S-methyltransferase [Pseudomonadota bacterium]
MDWSTLPTDGNRFETASCPTHAGPAGEPIRFAVGACWLGTVLAATSDKGIASILLGSNAQSLRRDLRARWPAAVLVDGGAELGLLLTKVLEFLEAPAGALDLPLDARGSEFQQRVWQTLRGIPSGSTASYSEIARRVGAPKEPYAVADACAANPIAVAIPCHRVVRKDGTLAGYRWGVKRKRALLEREAGARMDDAREPALPLTSPAAPDSAATGSGAATR